MTRKVLYEHPGWQWCTAEGAELHTLLIGLQTTFREKLDWLEEGENLTLRPVAPWLQRFALRASRLACRVAASCENRPPSLIPCGELSRTTFTRAPCAEFISA